MKYIEIDGRQGEGGGQILRSSLALSAITGKPLRISHIRAGRGRPGLLRQHLTCVQAAAQVSGAQVEGAELGSGQLTFTPSGIYPGTYQFAVGSAGSSCLVAQTVLPILMQADGPSELILEGGTHNMAAPPFHFLQDCFLPVLHQMGVGVEAKLERWGFFPAGGGRWCLRIAPNQNLQPFELLQRGPVRVRQAQAVVAGLPIDIAERELRAFRAKMNWAADTTSVTELPLQFGPGNVLLAKLAFDEGTEMVCGFGQKGMQAERIGKHCADALRRFLASPAVVGEHLADQLLLPMALAGSGAFRTTALSSHSKTNMAVIEQFLGVRFKHQTEHRDNEVVQLH